MSHDGNTSIENTLDGVYNLNTAFQLQGITTALLHDADGIGNTLGSIHLIRAEGHVAHHEGALHTIHNGTGVVNHLVDCHGQRRGIAHHHVGGRVAHEDAVNACPVDYACGSKIVGGEHADFLTLLFHLNKATRRHLALVAD